VLPGPRLECDRHDPSERIEASVAVTMASVAVTMASVAVTIASVALAL